MEKWEPVQNKEDNFTRLVNRELRDGGNESLPLKDHLVFDAAIGAYLETEPFTTDENTQVFEAFLMQIQGATLFEINASGILEYRLSGDRMEDIKAKIAHQAVIGIIRKMQEPSKPAPVTESTPHMRDALESLRAAGKLKDEYYIGLLLLTGQVTGNEKHQPYIDRARAYIRKQIRLKKVAPRRLMLLLGTEDDGQRPLSWSELVESYSGKMGDYAETEALLAKEIGSDLITILDRD